MTKSKIKLKTKNVTTTIKENDYDFLKENHLQVSAALSIGVHTLRKIYETGLYPEDIQIIKDLRKKLETF